jgi:hypothetical protein
VKAAIRLREWSRGIPSLIVGSFVGLSPSGAATVSVSDVSYSGQVTVGTYPGGTPFQPVLSAPGGASQEASLGQGAASSFGEISITSTPSVWAYVAANSGTFGQAGGDAFASATYYMTIRGPSANAKVDVSMAGGIATSALPNGGSVFAKAQMTISGSQPIANFSAIGATPDSEFSQTANVSGTPGSGMGGGFATSQPLRVTGNGIPQIGNGGIIFPPVNPVPAIAIYPLDTDTIYSISIYSQVGGGTLGLRGVDLNAVAWVDPTFSIDPSTPNADQYSITFSPGISNSFPVATPVPGTLVLLCSGLIGLMSIMRSRTSPTARPLPAS